MYKLVLVITAAAASAECVVKKQTHAFYYLWYGTPTTDGKWLHWDHAVLPHWTKKVRRQYKHLENYTHEPPSRLHAPFYPAAGPYSSSDPQLLDAHFSQLRDAGVRPRLVATEDVTEPFTIQATDRFGNHLDGGIGDAA